MTCDVIGIVQNHILKSKMTAMYLMLSQFAFENEFYDICLIFLFFFFGLVVGFTRVKVRDRVSIRVSCISANKILPPLYKRQ